MCLFFELNGRAGPCFLNKTIHFIIRCRIKVTDIQRQVLWSPNNHTYRETELETDRDRETERHTKGQPDRQRQRQRERQTDTDRQS